jgi:hypothetical protein
MLFAEEHVNKPKAKFHKTSEVVHRVYPKDNAGLPLLDDRNNYYSGHIDDLWWHQNSDQVLVHIPIDSSISKHNVDAKFTTTHVKVTVAGETYIAFDTNLIIIPHGSFWTLESDNMSNKYIQLDLEKR